MNIDNNAHENVEIFVQFITKCSTKFKILINAEAPFSRLDSKYV